MSKGRDIFTGGADILEQNEKIILEMAMETANMSSWVYDVATGDIYQSKASQMQHGYADTVTNVPESIIADGFVHQDSIDTYRSLFRKVTEKDTVIRGDVYVKTADRKDYWWERIALTPIFDADGNHVRSIGTSLDITEQKTMEGRFERQIEAFYSADSKGLIAKGLYDLSKNSIEYYHEYTDEAVKSAEVSTYDGGLNSTASLFVNAEESEKFIIQFDRSRLLQQFIKGSTEETVEYRRKTRDERTIWAQTVARLYRGPVTGNTMCFIYSYDINDSKIAQEMISNVVNLDYDYLTLLDLDNNEYIMYANSDDPDNPIPPLRSTDYEKTVVDYAHKYLVEEDIERNIRDMSIDNIRKQLADKDFFISYVSMKDRDGGLSRKKLQYSYMDKTHAMVLLSRMDITDIYEREQEQMRELSDANRAKNDFLSQMSHDLRTPMNAIIGLSNLAKDELNDPPAMKQYIDSINAAGQFLLGLVNDCLDMEKLSAGKMLLHEAPYIYPQFVNNICTIIAPLCKSKNIKLIIDTLPDPYYISIDHIRFEQIFINLLNNSVKYTPEGGTVELRVVSNERKGDLVHSHLMVRDNGIGMSEEFQTRMFLPFEQESPGSNQQERGTGLGLPIVKELLELMGGKWEWIPSWLPSRELYRP
ncbi:PAS domain-containing sensor histidine kinase [Aminicella lysinilytica]|uniref:PAS domain-containing sensor histidine kinase n=1 Tax=Aminicella lysinilytica TaxID=433323 RepID=UPI0026ECA101|nr:PAS domain-containing sensor histidine kinase [Aminicella lysinilytica]